MVRLLVLSIACLAAAVSGVVAADAPATLLKVGFSERDITPEIGMDGVHRHYLVEASGRVRFDYPVDQQTLSSRVPYYAVVRAAAERRAGEPSGCAARPDAVGVTVPLTGFSAHPEPVVSAFQLLFAQPGGSGPDAEHPENNLLAPNRSVAAVGHL